jgi:undecaprenyl-diphosphatase
LRNDPWTWVGLICALAFVILAVEVNERDAIGFDDPVIALVQGLGVPTDVWLALTAAGAGVLLPIGIAVVVSLLLLRRPRTAVVYAGAMIGAALWTQVVKVYIARLRPPAGALVPAPGFSFPSGHTLNSTVTYGLIALLVWRSDLPAWLRRLTAVSLTTLIILIGLSRIALGVHYPSDVVGAGWPDLPSSRGGVVDAAVISATTHAARGSLRPRVTADIGLDKESQAGRSCHLTLRNGLDDRVLSPAPKPARHRATGPEELDVRTVDTADAARRTPAALRYGPHRTGPIAQARPSGRASLSAPSWRRPSLPPVVRTRS